MTDADGATASAKVGLTIQPVNDAPVAADVSTAMPEDTVLDGTLTASGRGWRYLVVSKGSDPTHGSVTVNADGTYTYTPVPNYHGPVSDGNSGTVTKTVSINVTTVNDPPVAVNDSAGVVEDADTTGNILTYHDALSVSSTLTVDDGHGGVVTKTFIWPITNPAQMASNDTVSVKTGQSVTVPVLTNDVDPDGDPLTVTRAKAGNGTVEILPDGSIKYTPQPGFVGHLYRVGRQRRHGDRHSCD